MRSKRRKRSWLDWGLDNGEYILVALLAVGIVVVAAFVGSG